MVELEAGHLEPAGGAAGSPPVLSLLQEPLQLEYGFTSSGLLPCVL